MADGFKFSKEAFNHKRGLAYPYSHMRKSDNIVDQRDEVYTKHSLSDHVNRGNPNWREPMRMPTDILDDPQDEKKYNIPAREILKGEE